MLTSISTPAELNDMSPADQQNWLFWSQVARDWATAFTFLAALLAGIFGLFRYVRSERIRQTEQVRELYRMFFESERYRRIRFVLAHPASAEIAALRAQCGDDDTIPGELEGELIDLLNFFEFVSGMMRRGLIHRRDVEWMFQSFIDDLVSIDFVRDYILTSDYDELHVICRKRMEKKR
jgi:hypothetical protein